MGRPSLEVADIFRDHGAAWRLKNQGHLALGQLKVMSAIEQCRSAALGGHALRCHACERIDIAYNSCRNRHCPKCQSLTAKQWLADRQAELLPVEYYHLVFTLPAPIADMAYQNKSAIYELLFHVTRDTLLTLAADPKHLGAQIGFTAVLHTWGSAMTHHPHLHCIVPGGGLAANGTAWVPCRSGFFIPVRVLSRLFRRLFLAGLQAAHQAGRLRFYASLQPLTDWETFLAALKPLYQTEWVVYAKRPFRGPEAVLAYLSRYTHRVAISNSRLIACDADTVTFKWKDYRQKKGHRYKTMRLSTEEFIRRFLLHVLPHGFHRIRHFGIFANPQRARNVAHIRTLLPMLIKSETGSSASPQKTLSGGFICRSCKAPLIIIDIIPRTHIPRAPP